MSQEEKGVGNSENADSSSHISERIVNEKPEEISEEADEATAGAGAFAIDIPGTGEEKQRFKRGRRDDDERGRNKMESLEELISSVGLPIHSAFVFLIPIHFTAVQVQFQGKNVSPFEACPKSMWAFLVATFIYGFGLVANMYYSGTVYSPHIGRVVMLAGSFSSAALISVLLPSFSGLVILFIWGVLAIMIARNWSEFLCSRIHTWIMVIFCKIYGLCYGLLYKHNSIKEVEMEESV